MPSVMMQRLLGAIVVIVIVIALRGEMNLGGDAIQFSAPEDQVDQADH